MSPITLAEAFALFPGCGYYLAQAVTAGSWKKRQSNAPDIHPHTNPTQMNASGRNAKKPPGRSITHASKVIKTPATIESRMALFRLAGARRVSAKHSRMHARAVASCGAARIYPPPRTKIGML